MGDSPELVNLPTGSGTLHDRERELALLEAALMNAKASESQLILIEGQAGIGKSRLLLETRQMAEKAGFTNVIARGYEFERDYPFGVLRQLITSAQRAQGDHGVSSEADQADALLESLGGEGAAENNIFTIYEGLYWATVRAAETTPVLIAIDDLQWCDRVSLEYLAYLARRIESLPIAIVATLRPADSSAAAASVRELMSDPGRLSISPRPLGESSVSAMASERLGFEPDSEFVNELVTITDGNPLLVDELLKELAAEGVQPTRDNVDTLREVGPRAASRSVLLRLARLDDCCSDVARALTIIGEGMSVQAIARFTDNSEEGVATAVSRNINAEIFRPDQPLGFVHPLVREAIYRDIPSGERELMHMRAARELDESGAPSEQVAGQLLNVPPRGDQWVVEKLRHAGSVAMSKSAVTSTISYLSRALEEPPPRAMRGEVLRDLGIAEAMANKAAGADHLLEAYELIDDPLQRGFIAVIAMRLLSLAHRNEEAVELGERTIAQLSPEHENMRMRLENGLASISTIDSSARSFDLLKPLLDNPVSKGDSLEARMFDGAISYGKMLRGDPADECVEVAIRGLEDGALYQYDNAGFPMIGIFVTLAVADDDRALDVCKRSLDSAGAGGALYVPAVARAFMGYTLVLRGDLQGAMELLELTKADVETFDLWLGYTQASAMLTLANVERGDLQQAEIDLKFGEKYLQPGVQHTTYMGSKLHLRVEQGRNAEAVEVAELIERTSHPEMIRNPAWLPWRSLKAEALDGLGRTDEAIVLAEDELEAARRWGRPRALGRSLRVLGQLKRKDGMAELEESVEVLRGSVASLEYGWSLAALGQALRHERKAVEAREPLTEALEIASRAGALGLEKHVREELAASGAAPRTTDFEGMDSLTPSERRVAGLAIEGMTNREIAQSLFVTPKTVEVHLSNVYKKLNVKSRKDLPSVFVVEDAA